MIILDTNIISELMSPKPSLSVVTWSNQQQENTLYITTITVAEIHYGLNLLPLGQKRTQIEQRFEQFVQIVFSQHILSFDKEAAPLYGEMMAHRRKNGRILSPLDGQIAAIARAKGFAVATRNQKNFDDLGVFIINPFQLATD